MRVPGEVIKGVLTPQDRASEVLFGLIMSLTVTGALGVTEATEPQTHALFASTLACNVAWGLVDAVMYVLSALFGRGRGLLLARGLKESTDPGAVPAILSEVLPASFVDGLTASDVERIRREAASADLDMPARIRGEDLLGALGVFLLVVASTFPVAVPFLLLQDIAVAKLVSRGLALMLMFLSGYAVGRYSGFRPARVGGDAGHRRGAGRGGDGARRMRVRRAALLLLVLGPLGATEAAGQPMELVGHDAQPWSLGASLSWYFVHDGQNFGVGTATADHGPLHIEARYNYEALKTGSAFVGWNFELGETVTFGFTPIVGCMVGEAGGPIVGLELAIGWGPLSFSSQGEWVTDVKGDTGGFVYVWSELDVRPWEWLRAGMVVQRTRVFHTAREVVFGPLLGVSFWKLELSAYWFQPGGIDPFFVAAVAISF